MGLMMVFVVLTGLVHYGLDRAITPLLHSLPHTRFRQNRDDQMETRQDVQNHCPDDIDDTDFEEERTGNFESDGATENGFSTEFKKSSSWTLERARNFFLYFQNQWLCPVLDKETQAISEAISSQALNTQIYPVEGKRSSYLPPELWLPSPTIWIPEDEAGVSRQEVEHGSRYTPMTSSGAMVQYSGRIKVDFQRAPIDEVRWRRWRWEAIESIAPSLLSPDALGL